MTKANILVEAHIEGWDHVMLLLTDTDAIWEQVWEKSYEKQCVDGFERWQYLVLSG